MPGYRQTIRLAAGLIILASCSGAAADTVHALFAAYKAGDRDKAVSCYVAADRAEAAKAFDRMSVEDMQKAKQAEIRVVATRVLGSRAQVDATVASPSSKDKGVVTLVLMKEEGEWRVSIPGSAERFMETTARSVERQLRDAGVPEEEVQNAIRKLREASEAERHR